MLIVREALPKDAHELVVILNAIIKEGGTTAYQTPKNSLFFDALICDADPLVMIHVAELDGQVIGVQWVEPLEDRETAGIATFAKLGVVQKGIGKALFETTSKACQAAGYTAIDAVIRADNSGGLAYYSKMGFEDHSVHKNVALTDGTPIDRVRKRLVL